MMGGQKQQPLGYTIIEVMIFLAVSGIMFVIAASFISGRQAQVEFHNNTNSLESTIRNTVDDVQNGLYPADPGVNLRCEVGSGGTTQGTNGACIFLGKAFDTANGSSSYDIESISGNRLDNNGNSVVTLGDVGGVTGAHPWKLANATESGSLGRLTVEQMCKYPADGSASSTSYGFAVISSLNQDAQAGSSGAPTTALLYGYPGAVGDITSLSGAIPLSKAVIFVDDSQRAAKITIVGDAELTTSIAYMPAAGSYVC